MIAHPRALAAYRAVSQRDSMTGVMSPTFKCCKCHAFKRVPGRKKTAAGYVCKGCAGG